MLTRFSQLFQKKRVDPPANDEVDRQRIALLDVRKDIDDVRSQLMQLHNSLRDALGSEQKLEEQLSCLLMETHDEYLALIQGPSTSSSAASSLAVYPPKWVDDCNCAIVLADSNATLQRITESSTVEQRDDDDGSSSSCDEEEDEEAINAKFEKALQEQKKQSDPNKKQLDFVCISSDSYDSSSDHDDQPPPPTASVVVKPMKTETNENTNNNNNKPIAPPSTTSPPSHRHVPKKVFHLGSLIPSDFTDPLAYHYFQNVLGRMRLREVLYKELRQGVVRDVRLKREELESRLFERQCKLIHLEAFEVNAVEQLQRYDRVNHSENSENSLLEGGGGGRQQEMARHYGATVESDQV